VTAFRTALVAVGALLATYGGWLLVSRQDLEQVAAAVVWLVGGVLLHDAVLAPLTILLVALAVRWLPDEVRRPATVALIVVGPLTLLAVPVLGRFGARPDNSTLLDRPYVASWLVLLALSVLVVAVASVVVRSRQGGGTREEGADGTGTGRR
jgi:hypothetical protein